MSIDAFQSADEATIFLTAVAAATHSPPRRATMHRQPPHEVVELLRAVRSDAHNPDLARVLECWRNRWLRWARQRRPGLRSLHEDAVQNAQILVLQRWTQLRDPARVEPWADQVFQHALSDLAKAHRRGARWMQDAGAEQDSENRWVGLPDARATPEELAGDRERLRIVCEVARACHPAWLRFVEDLSEKEIQDRTRESRDHLATLLKRMRAVLRNAMDGTGADGKPVPPEKIIEQSGLSREIKAAILAALQRALRSSRS